jgi:hypothetical protein
MARPTLYNSTFNEQARKLCLLGATDKELADFFDVAESTIHLWKRDHPRFSESIKAGKIKADALVAHKLYHRAIGYKHDAVKILTVADGNNQGSHVEKVPYVEHYPPDPTSMIFWLKNRRPDLWRDKQDVELAGDAARPLTIRVVKE